MIAGVETPDEGRILIDGVEVFGPNTATPPEARGVGLMFQDFALFPHLTVAGNVAFGLRRDVPQREARVDALLEKVNLTGFGDKHPHQLSGGEQQRVSIARAFVNRPLILLADEPTGNLDPATGEGIMRLLERINTTGTTVVMATHDQRIVNMMRRRVVQLDRGVIVRDQERGVYD